ncbi:MAG: hypothetical protein SPL96_03705 [Bacteroidales bacterium]|nr:hypothetical protein [Bacteroidales bacterium]
MKRRIFLTLSCLLTAVCAQLSAQNMLYMGDNYYRKNMLKTFKSIKEHKLDKAEKYREDILKKALKDKDISPNPPIEKQLYPVWDLSTAMIMNTRDGRGKSTSCPAYNPWTAYGLIKEVSRLAINVQNANLFLSDKDVGLTFADIKNAIEANLIDSVRKVKTESAYDKLISTLFDYKNLSMLHGEREQVAYDEVKKTHQLSECKRYLEKYTGMNQTHRAAIEWRRDSLAFDELSYTAAACKQYLADYPSSRYRMKVEERLHKCAFDELEQTVDACKQYLKQYPSSEYFSQVKALQEKYAYRDAQKQNSVGAYRDFIKEYPYSDHQDEARQLMQQALMGRYFNSNVTLNALYRVCGNLGSGASNIDGSCIKTLYNNLLLMPTSAVMMGCDGLTGRVTITSDSEYANDGEETFEFNQQGLMTLHYNSLTGINDDYTYGFDPQYGFKLVSKTDAHGKTVTYTTQWDYDGALKEIKGSDGTRYVFSYDGYYTTVSYYKGSSLVKKDSYDKDYCLVESARSGGIVLKYEHNSYGDVITMAKTRGGVSLEETTYDYYYTSATAGSHQWTEVSQYNNGSFVVTRSRSYYNTNDRVQSTSRKSYSIDWHDVRP